MFAVTFTLIGAPIANQTFDAGKQVRRSCLPASLTWQLLWHMCTSNLLRLSVPLLCASLCYVHETFQTLTPPP